MGEVEGACEEQRASVLLAVAALSTTTRTCLSQAILTEGYVLR